MSISNFLSGSNTVKRTEGTQRSPTRLSSVAQRAAAGLTSIRASLPGLQSLEKFGNWLGLITTTTPSVARTTPPEEQTKPDVAVARESPPPPQQPTKHTGPLFMALPEYKSPSTTIKDKIIAQLEIKLLDIDTSKPTIKFGNTTETGYPKAKLEEICELLHQWKDTVNDDPCNKNELEVFINNTKSKFEDIGITTYNEHWQEHVKDAGSEFLRFTAETNVTDYSKLESRISAINLKLSDSDLPELKFNEGQLDQTYTLKLLRNKNFLYLLQTDRNFKDGIQSCCRDLDIQEKDSGMSSNNSEVTTIVCTFAGQTTQVRGNKTFESITDGKALQDHLVYNAGQLEIKMGKSWRKEESVNSDQMPTTLLYNKLLELNDHLGLNLPPQNTDQMLVTTLRSDINTLRSPSKKEACKKLLQDHGFIDFLRDNPSMDTVMEKTLSIAIHRDGTKLTPDRSKFIRSENFDFYLNFKDNTHKLYEKINYNLKEITPPLPDSNTQSPAG